MKKIYWIHHLLLCIPMLLDAQVVIHLESLPASSPEQAEIYLAGSINGWNPADTNFRFEDRNEEGYWLDIASGSGTMEFKFTRGSWATVEGNATGSYLPNRSFTFGSRDTLHLSILSWEDLDSGSSGANSTANVQVQIWDASMYMPQLDRNRRIWVYLPQAYETSGESYPVLYMHDGQNVFDASTSFAGEWKVDETLTSLENRGLGTAIVVAIDNGGGSRLDEYSPFVNPSYGGGEGDAYLDFIIETLMPKIDSAFRTLKGPENTGIMGSSMGGLISHYAYFRNPEVFGKIGVFSPSYWFSDEYFSYSSEQGKTGTPRIYLLAGGGEASIAAGVGQMYDQLRSEGFSEEEVKELIVPSGQHSEWFWAAEFEKAFLWLFYPDQLLSATGSAFRDVHVFPNPVEEFLRIEGAGKMDVKMYNNAGALLQKHEIVDHGKIELAGIRSGMYFLLVEQDGLSRAFKILKI